MTTLADRAMPMNAESTRGSRGTVLIVDDTPGNLALLSDTLSEAGYRVLVATDGLSALDQINHLQPDIILLDVVMPGIDGFETCRKIKDNPSTAGIPILFMTGRTELNDLLRGFNEGGRDYIVKPIKPPEVLARLEVHLNQARTLLRAESALSHAPFAAFSVDRDGRIVWLMPSAESLLAELDNARPFGIGTLAPKPVLEWIRSPVQAGNASGQLPSDAHRSLGALSLRLSRCPNSGEFLVLLQKHAGEWPIEALKSTLGLTFREAEILMWISRGKTNKEVGIILGSSPRTVNKHLEHSFEKLGVTTRAAAVALVLQRTIR